MGEIGDFLRKLLGFLVQRRINPVFTGKKRLIFHHICKQADKLRGTSATQAKELGDTRDCEWTCRGF